MTWIRRTIWNEGDRYESADDADLSHVVGDACVLAANLGETITVHVDGFPLEVERGADHAVLRATVEKHRKAAKKKAAKKIKAPKKAPAKKSAVKKARAPKPKKAAKKATKRRR